MSPDPSPSMQPSGSVSQPLETNEWLMGLFLLILTAAPIATILVLYHEESGFASTVRRSDAAHLVPEQKPSAAYRAQNSDLDSLLLKLSPGRDIRVRRVRPQKRS